MSLFICSLNSGSNGNCYYVGSEKHAVLIDAGISCREIEKRLLRSGLSAGAIRAVFVSHEHSDHIRGIEVFTRKHNLPVYMNEKTFYNSHLPIPQERLNFFTSNQSLTIGDLVVEAFSKYHDAADPCSFSVSCGGVKVAVITDIGKACGNVREHFSSSHAVFLEANYDEKMLSEGDYPYHLKRRISSDRGHLSNTEALSLFRSARSGSLQHLILSHLSRENNCPSIVQELFHPFSGNTRITVASRYAETEVFCVTAGVSEPKEKTEQLSLF